MIADSDTRVRTLATLTAVVVVLSLLATGSVGAQSTPTVELSVTEAVSVDATESGELRVTDVTHPDGVGSFEMTFEYDPAVVTIAASETGSFALTQSEEPGELQLVGYTSELPGPDGDVALAEITVSGDSSGTTTVEPTVHSLTTADADTLDHDVSSATLSVASTGSGQGGDGGGGGGGGGAVAEPETAEEGMDETDADVGTEVEDEDQDTPVTDEPTPDGSDPEEADDSIPGFGVIAALTALFGVLAGRRAFDRLP